MSIFVPLLLASPAPPPEGFSMSWEGIAAIAALSVALGEIFALVYMFGRLTNKLETTESAVGTLAEQQEKNRLEAKSDQDKLGTKVDGIASAVGQLQGEVKRIGRKRGDSDE